MNVGDFSKLLSLTLEPIADPGNRQTFLRTMISDRNEAWIPHLRNIFDQGDAVVAVGAAHLPGQDGLVDLLRVAGYTVILTRLPSM